MNTHFSPFIIPQWSAPKHIKAISTTRNGGKSKEPYASFNLGLHVGDNEEHVLSNRKDLLYAASLPSSPKWLNQVHSNISILAETIESEGASIEIPSVDASHTQRKGIVCAVMTADCLPLLVTNHMGTEIAAIHAGWRGLANGIVENTLKSLVSSPESLVVWIGPSISQSYYEVGEDVLAAFAENHTSTECQQAFTMKDAINKKWLANMPLLAQQRLIRCGVEIQSIYLSNECTYMQPERYFSYRRDGITGRMASLIWIDK